MAASLLALQLLTGVTSAATPSWDMTIERQPPAVNNGELTGFTVTITNFGNTQGGSNGNIAQLFYVDSLAVAAFSADPSQGACVTSPDLMCTLGALNAGQSVTIDIVYDTPDTGNSLVYSGEANTTGVSFNDKGKSHGDSLKRTVTTGLSTSQNFGGKFNTENNGNVHNNTQITGNNQQSAELFGLAAGVGASVEDGLPNNAFSCGTACAGKTAVGEWTRIIVDNGRLQNAFKAVITIKGGAQGITDTSSIFGYHVLDGGQVVIVGDTITQTPGVPQSSASEQCASATAPNSPLSPDGCIKVTVVGNNLQVVLWLTTNGGTRVFK